MPVYHKSEPGTPSDGAHLEITYFQTAAGFETGSAGDGALDNAIELLAKSEFIAQTNP